MSVWEQNRTRWRRRRQIAGVPAPPDPGFFLAPGLLIDPRLSTLEKLLRGVLDVSAAPSQRDLADLFNVSVRTLQHALRDLARFGWICVLPRDAGRQNRYIPLTPGPADPARSALLARVRGAPCPYRPTAGQLFFRTDEYQDYLRTFCRKNP